MSPRKQSPRDIATGCIATSGLAMVVLVLAAACAARVESAASASPTMEPVAAATPPRTPAPTVWDPEIGNNARLHVSGGSDQLIPLAISEEAYKQLSKAFAANDQIGLRDLLILGLVFTVDNDTRVLVIDSGGGFFEDSRYRVRVLEGKQQTRAGWVLGTLLTKP